MQVVMLILLCCTIVLLPLSFKDMNNPYAPIMHEIQDLLKKRFTWRRIHGRFNSITYQEYEDRILKRMPFLSAKDLRYKYTDTGKRHLHCTKRLFS